MAKTNSPLRYPGGKAFLAPTVSAIIKDNGFQKAYYAEPFAGGGGVALNLLFSETVCKIFLNDADFHIFAFWKSILDETEQFCRKIKTVPLTIAQWKKQKKIYDSYDVNSIFDVGFATFYLNRTNRSGILNGGPIGGFEQNGKWKINARFNKQNLIKRIKKIVCYKKRICISNKDALDFLSKLNKFKKDVFIYLDPPYYKHGPDLYFHYYTTEDHEMFARYIQENVYHPWILSYDNIKEITELYKIQKSLPFKFTYSVNSHKKGSELLFLSPRIKNYLCAIFYLKQKTTA